MPGLPLPRCRAAILLLIGTLLVNPFAGAGDRPGQLNIGYFPQWPAPLQFAQAQATLDRVLGLEVNWLPYPEAGQMVSALVAGDVQIAYSLGHVPFLVGVNGGLDLSMVGVAVSYPDGDNCIVSAAAGIDPDNPASFRGQAVALRPGSVSHFRLNRVLEHLGVEPSTLELVPVRDGNEAMLALRRGDVSMACAWGSALRAMATLGKPLMSGAGQEALGLRLFDVIAVTTPFLERHPEIIRTFLEVTDAANRQWQANPDSMRRMIARMADMDRAASDRALLGFRFPTTDAQKSQAWMGGRVAAYSGELARFFVAHGQLDEALDSYDRFVTTRYLP